jgi:propanol-preferring alcohol dehydrogenase
MRAAVAEAPDQPLVVRELPIPRPGPGELLLKVSASGICHTDIHLIGSDWQGKKPRFPLVPGHEGCGVVADLGEGVRDFKAGDRVGVFWLNSACGSCECCVTGHENVCAEQQGTGYSVNGTYADYCVVRAAFAVRLPEGEFHTLAPVLCAGVTSYKALKELHARPGAVIVVSGVGGTGHLAIQYAKALGYEVIAIDVEDHKLELATRLGASFVLNAEKTFPVNRVLNRTAGGAHGVLVTAVATKAFEQGVRMLRRRGTCVVIGVPPDAMELSVSDMILRELTVRGSVAGTREDVREALSFVADGRVRPIVETVPLEQVNAAMDAVRGRRVNGRVVLTMG